MTSGAGSFLFIYLCAVFISIWYVNWAWSSCTWVTRWRSLLARHFRDMARSRIACWWSSAQNSIFSAEFSWFTAWDRIFSVLNSQAPDHEIDQFSRRELISVFNSLTAQWTYESLTRHAMQIDSLKSNQSIGRFPPQPSLLKFRASAKHSFIPLSPSL